MKKRYIFLTLTLCFFGVIYTNAQVPSYVPTDSLVAWWPFSGNAIDSSGNGYNLTNNNVSYTVDRFGVSSSSAYFNGNSSSLVSGTYFPEFTGTVNQTYSIWFKNGVDDWRYLLEYGNSSGARFQLLPSTRSPGNPINVAGSSGCLSCGGGSNLNWPIGSGLRSGWHHIVIAIDSTTITTYYDGVNKGAKAHTGFTCNNTSYRLYLGSDILCIPEYPRMYLDDLGIWNRTLSATEIAGLYASTACSNTSSTDTITSCGPYTWTNGVTYTSSNNTATDTFVNAAGCDSIVTLNLTVQDVIKPTVVTQNLTVSLDATGSGSITATQVDNGSTDNCTIATRTLSKSSFDCSDVGANTVYLIVTDVNGNVDSASAVITVQDVIKPTVVSTPSDIALGYCDAAYTYVLPTGDDNCGITVTQIAGLPPGSNFPVGETVNTFEISDPSGNSVTTSFIVDIRARYMPFTNLDLSLCKNNSKIDLTKGFDNILFMGSGVEANEKFFNPNSLEPGSYSMTAEFTDSMGCVSTEQFVIEIRSTPIIPIIKRVASDQIVTVRAYNNYQWYRNGEEIEGEDKQLLRVHKLGIYSVLVGNDDNCFEASEGYGFGIPVNEEHVTNQGYVKVFPNPTRGMVFVQINDEVEFHLLTLSDAVGNKLIEQETSTKVVKLDLTSLPSGFYYLNVLGGITNENIVIIKN